jgi:hypothetical protein
MTKASITSNIQVGRLTIGSSPRATHKPGCDATSNNQSRDQNDKDES